MPIPRFYCSPPLGDVTELELAPAAAHHASRVLRLRVNDTVQLFDGTGIELTGSIREISSKSVVLEKLQVGAVNRESPLHIVLAQALCSSEKMDWVVQKATELGIAEIQPVQSLFIPDTYVKRDVPRTPAGPCICSPRTVPACTPWRSRKAARAICWPPATPCVC